MAVTKEIVLEVGLKDSTGQGAESAKKRLREMQRALVDLAVAGQENTEEFRRLEAEAGQLSDTIGDVSQRVKNLGSDTKNIEAFTQAVQGVAAGFQIAQGAAALFGEENEDIQKAMLQVNATGEADKGGCEVSGLSELFTRAIDLGLDVVGLMTVGPTSGDIAVTRRAFETTARLAHELGVPEVSMGMTADMEAAIAEGSTCVRVGTAIFGARPTAA